MLITPFSPPPLLRALLPSLAAPPLLQGVATNRSTMSTSSSAACARQNPTAKLQGGGACVPKCCVLPPSPTPPPLVPSFLPPCSPLDSSVPSCNGHARFCCAGTPLMHPLSPPSHCSASPSLLPPPLTAPAVVPGEVSPKHC